MGGMYVNRLKVMEILLFLATSTQRSTRTYGQVMACSSDRQRVELCER